MMYFLKLIWEKKFLVGIIISGLITYALSFFELKNAEGQYNYNPVLGILTLLIVILGYIVNIYRFRDLKFAFSASFKDAKISKLIFIQYSLSIVINLLLIIFGLEMLGVEIFVETSPSGSVVALGMLLMIVSLVLLAVEMLHFDKTLFKAKKLSRLNGSLSDFMLLVCTSWSIAIIWTKNNFIVDVSNSSIFASIFNFAGISLLYFLLCLPVHRVYYLQLELENINQTNRSLLIVGNMISVVFGAILPCVKW